MLEQKEFLDNKLNEKYKKTGELPCDECSHETDCISTMACPYVIDKHCSLESFLKIGLVSFVIAIVIWIVLYVYV